MNTYFIDADGGNVKQLTGSKSADRSRAPAWSPDGKKIIFGRTVGTNGCGIFVMDPDGGNVKQLNDGDGWDHDWPPDGKKILFTRADNDGFRIHVMDGDGANEQQPTTN